jgi:SAM-dependent methyltransferase
MSLAAQGAIADNRATTEDFAYVGQELDLFAAATNWKSYFRRHLRPYLGSEVLEVGAGLGGTTRLLARGTEHRWICLEPDPRLAARVQNRIDRSELPPCCQVHVGALADLRDEARFDTVLYIDVLEHIADDREEVAQAAGRLVGGGHLVVLAPAHPCLYAAFDASVGHYRRYTKATLAQLTPNCLEEASSFYLDSVGTLASLANRLLLRSGTPTRLQIALWDRVLVSASRFVDPLLGYRWGKTVVAVWRKKA